MDGPSTYITRKVGVVAPHDYKATIVETNPNPYFSASVASIISIVECFECFVPDEVWFEFSGEICKPGTPVYFLISTKALWDVSSPPVLGYCVSDGVDLWGVDELCGVLEKATISTKEAELIMGMIEKYKIQLAKEL